jgi:citrate lyase subunit beta/citryl-CoA lyase
MRSGEEVMQHGITATAGNQGERVKTDCFVTLAPAASGALTIHIDADGPPPVGGPLEDLARRVCRFFGIESGHLTIHDQGAPPFVVAARIEACIQQLMPSEKTFLLPDAPVCPPPSPRKRMRLSRLYLPGNTPKMMLGAASHQPHGIILDLEDAVAPSKKAEARLLARNALRHVDFGAAERMVRINQLPLGLTDLRQIVPHGVQLVLIPKCETAAAIEAVNAEIEAIQHAQRLTQEIYLMPIIETCRGILNAAAMAAAGPNVVALAIGLEDYTADLGVKRTVEGSESFYARSHLVTVCKAFGLQAIDSVFSDFGDADGLTQSVARSKALGFEGMGCIHPKQIPIVHAGYAPDAAEIEKAKKIVRAFEEAGKKGLGVVALGTKMIDPPVVDRAQQVIERSIALGMLSAAWAAADA